MQSFDYQLEEGTDHAGESAEIVRNAIAGFDVDDMEAAVQSMTTADNFMDVWFMDKNREKRPRFLKAVATPETVDSLISYLSPKEGSSEARPAHLLRMTLGIMNRLIKEERVGKTMARTRLNRVLVGLKDAALTNPHPVNRLMCLEVATALMGFAEDKTKSGDALVETGYSAVLLQSIASPTLVSQNIPVSSEKETPEEIASYSELCGMMASQLLARALCSDVPSPKLIETGYAPQLMLALIQTLANTSSWKQRRVLESHARDVLRLRQRYGDAWDKHDASERDKAIASIRSGAQKGWLDCVQALKELAGEDTKCCAICGLTEGKLLLCGQCKMVWYCGKDHQTSHWKLGHKTQCKKPQ